MNQLDLIPREKRKPLPGCVLIPGWIPISQQNALLQLLRRYTKNGWYTPTMPNGTPMKHPLACLGLQWRPYEYFEERCPVPEAIVLMAIAALKDAGLDEFLPFEPDTGIVNMFPPGSSLGMHQDKSENHLLLGLGSPIITVSLGDNCIFRLGNSQNVAMPYEDLELRSGDLLVMSGHSRMSFHGVMKILPGTCPSGLEMHAPGRISLTLRQARINNNPIVKFSLKDRVRIKSLDRIGVVYSNGSYLNPHRILIAPLTGGQVIGCTADDLELLNANTNLTESTSTPELDPSPE